MFAAIRRLFSNDVQVTVSPSSVTLECRGRAVSLQPHLYYSRGPSGLKAVAFDQPPSPVAQAERVDVFDAASAARVGVEPEAALATYFREAIRLVPAGLVAVRPAVTVRGVESLRNRLRGESHALFQAAFKAAGAHSCEVIS
jgi:hypothetical protein